MSQITQILKQLKWLIKKLDTELEAKTQAEVKAKSEEKLKLQKIAKEKAQAYYPLLFANENCRRPNSAVILCCED